MGTSGKPVMKGQRGLGLLFFFVAVIITAGARKPGKKPKPTKPKPQIQSFVEEREVVIKKKTFTCTYTLKYKVAGAVVVVDKKKSEVKCSPDSKGKPMKVTESFTVNTTTVQVTHVIKKGKDTITAVDIVDGTDGSSGSGSSGGGSSGSGGAGGSGSGSGGSGGSTVSGDDMDCTCTMPLPDMSALSSSTPVAGRKLVSRVISSVRGNGHGHHGVSQGSNSLGQLLPLIILFLLSAFAAYGKVTLLQNLGILPTTGRSTLAEEQDQQQEQLEQLARLFRAADRQFGGGLGGLLGGGNGGSSNLVDGATNALVEQAIQQWVQNGGVQNLIIKFISGGGLETMVTQFLSGGGLESLMAAMMDNLDEQTLQSLGQAAGENLQQELSNIDMDGMMASMTAGLENDLEEMMGALEQAVANNQIEEPQVEMSCRCRPSEE